jgi:hypothetical protein
MPNFIKMESSKKVSLYCLILFLFTSCKPNGDDPITDPPIAKKILYSWNFSESNSLHDLAELTSNVSIVADPLDSTNKVLQCILPNGEYRTEASVGAPHYFNADNNDSIHGDEFWVGMRILKYKEPFTGSNTTPSIFQIGPVQNTVTYPGTTSAGHYQLTLSTTTNKWKWREYTSVFDPNTYSGEISSVNYGKWDRFVFHCRVRSNNTGLIEVWQNDVKIYSAARQNGIKYDRTRIKWGIYIGAGNTVHETLKCYFDDVKIGNRNAVYGDVVPK